MLIIYNLKLVILGALMTFLVVACGSQPRNNILTDSNSTIVFQACRLIEHDMGQTEVCGQPQTVAVLTPQMLDLLLSLDVQPAGYADPLSFYQGKTFNNPALQIPYLGERITTQPVNLGNSYSPSMETLAALKPDLIIGETGGPNYSLLTQVAPTLLWEPIDGQERWQQRLREIAKALNNDEEKAVQVIQSYEQQVTAAQQDLAATITSYPKLLLLTSDPLGQKFGVLNRNTYVGNLLEEVGFQVVTLPGSSDDQPFATISVEALPQLNEADIIIVLGYKYEVSDSEPLTNQKNFDTRFDTHQLQAAKQNWEQNAIAQSLTASQEGRVYFTTYYRWNVLKGAIGAELILEQLQQFMGDQ